MRNGTLGYRLKRGSASAKPQDSRPTVGNDSRPAASQEETFETIFLEHWQPVYHLLQNLVGSPAEAEDLALETFVRLHEHVPNLAGETNPGGWLRRVAVNLGLDAIRRWKRREHYELEAGRGSLEQAPGDNPSELLAHKEEQHYVRRVLAGMKPRSARLLILRYSGLSYQEIAGVLGLSPASIGPLLLRAEKEFKMRYRADGLEE